MKSIKNKVLASALALGLLSGSFALNPNYAEAASKPLQIKKVLNKAEAGVTTPAETFTFTFTAHSKNGDEGKKAEVPEVSNVTIAYTNADDTDNDTTVAGKQLIRESTDALTGVNWTAAGQYTYDVAEIKGSTEYMTYSEASYRVSVFVGQTAEGGYEVTDIQVKKLTDDSGNPVDDGKEEYKPGTGDDKSGNKFAFENNYEKKDGNDNPGGTDITDADKKGFALKKTVEDQGTDSFKFEFRVEKPVSTKSTDTGFDYYIVKADGTATKASGNYDDNIKVTLKHNERVVLGKVLLGSTVTVNETDSGKYEGSVEESMFNGTKGKVNTGIIGDQTGGNFVIYQNKIQTATGLLIDNLPFVFLVAVAGAGILFFVKNRKEALA